MFVAIFSHEITSGLGASDIMIGIEDVYDLDEANERAEEYAEENGISYVTLDVVDLNDVEII
jgi:hypothetical protein